MAVESAGAVDSIVENSIQFEAPIVDWNTLEINEVYDEYEGRLDIIEADQVYEPLGLRRDEEEGPAEQNTYGAARLASKTSTKGKGPAEQNTDGAALPVDDPTKYPTKKGKDTAQVSTKETILQNSPGRVTRR